MKKFYGYYDNGNFRVGCSGASVYVYDQNDTELARFKDIKYAYTGAFQPNTNIFVAKSTEGSLAIYDLDKLELKKKIIITRIGAQDEGFAFTPDGQFFYNIEKTVTSTRTSLAIYRTSDFELEQRCYTNHETMFLEYLEFDGCENNCYAFGYMRGDDGVFAYGFIGILSTTEVSEIKALPKDFANFVSWYKNWEISGYSEKSYNEHYLTKNGVKSTPGMLTLKDIYTKLP